MGLRFPLAAARFPSSRSTIGPFLPRRVFLLVDELGLNLLTCRGGSSISALKYTPKNEPCEYGSMTFSHSVVVTFIRSTFVHSASSNQLQFILSDRISLRIQYSRCFRTQGNGALNPRAALLSTHLKNRTGMGIFADYHR